MSYSTGIDDKLLDVASTLDEKYKIIETIGEGRYSKYQYLI
jgi:hypothetical protein